MAGVDGKFIIIKVGSVTVLGQTSGSDENSVNMLETTDKLSKDAITGITHKTYIAGDRDGTVSLEGNFDFNADNWRELYDLYLGQVVPATMYVGSTEVGETYIEQDGWLSGITRTYGQNAIATYSATFQKTGVPTVEVVPS